VQACGMHGQVKFRRQAPPDEGLRSRKKAKTRLAIEDAALSLFAKQGYEATTLEQIAERAEISPATFFHYFRGKADVVLSEHGAQVPALCQAIIDRPGAENDLTAVRRALLQTWAAHIDPERTARTARAVASSAVLQGMSYKIGQTWLHAMSKAIAHRRGLKEPSETSVLSAHVALGVLANAVEGWIESGCREDLKAAIERNFEAIVVMSADWAAPKRRRKSDEQ
jgi:AcrR family transcriptional regulator